MKKMMACLMALLMVFGIAVPTVGAAALTPEQKFGELKQKGIFSGFEDGSSRLHESMSREQLAAVLFRLLELPEQTTPSSYNDVLKTRWSYQEVEAVTRAGLMVGINNRVFSPASSVTVEQLAAVLIRSYGLNSSGSTPVTGKVSKWARGAVSLALDKQLIPKLNDYTGAATRAMLVEAVYRVYEDTNKKQLLVRSVEVLSNQFIKVNLLQVTNQADRNRFSLQDTLGNHRAIQQATLSQDGLSVVLTTDRQSSGIIHTLYVDGLAWSYISHTDDTTKPQVQSFGSLSSRILEITFSEPVEAKSATNASHYQVNNDLKLETLSLSQDQRKVTLTTKEQVHGKAYKLTVRNVKDLAGNVMVTRNDLAFTGNNDFSKPRVTEVKVNDKDATISVKFNEKINAAQAVENNRYSIDKGLAVTQATLNKDGITVILRTSPQKDATLYTLTVSGISDLAGNVMDHSTGWVFGGVPNPERPVKLENLNTLDWNTVELIFTRAITDSDVNNLKLAIISDNGAGVSMTDWKTYVRRKSGSDKAVTVQFRNKDSNPELFKTGHVYVGRVSGISGLQTSDDSDRLPFAGTTVENRIPYVTQVVGLGDNRVKVLFSEPVTNVDQGAFRIWDNKNQSIAIEADELNDKNRIVTEVVLKLKDKLTRDQTYSMTFNANIIMDAAKWNGLQTSDRSQPFRVEFKWN